MPSDAIFDCLLLWSDAQGRLCWCRRPRAASEARRPRYGGDVDDCATAAIAHQRSGRLRAQERPGEIDRQHARPILKGVVEDRLKDRNAGIVDESIEPAEFLRDGCKRARQRLQRRIRRSKWRWSRGLASAA